MFRKFIFCGKIITSSDCDDTYNKLTYQSALLGPAIKGPPFFFGPLIRYIGFVPFYTQIFLERCRVHFSFHRISLVAIFSLFSAEKLFLNGLGDTKSFTTYSSMAVNQRWSGLSSFVVPGVGQIA